MAGRGDDDGAILLQRDEVQAGGHRFGASAQQHVQIARGRQRQQLFAAAFLQVHLQVRMGPHVGRQMLRQQAAAGCRDGAQAQAASGAAAQGRDRVGRGAQRGEHAARAIGHQLTAAGGAHAAGVAFEQLHAQQGFDVRQGMGGGRLAHADLRGGLLQAAELGDPGQQLQVAQAPLGQQPGEQGGGSDVHGSNIPERDIQNINILFG